MARRFIVDNSDIKYFSKDENIMEIKGKEVKHIQVLRYDVSDIIIVNEYVCKIVKMHSNYIELQIISNAKKQGEPFINLSLLVALLKGDKMSMANSLEVRVPFLDIELMKLAEQIPSRYRVTGENTKVALRKASASKLPKETADKRKLGFPVPVRQWLKEDKYYNMLKDAFHSEIATELFNTEVLMKLLDDHKNGVCSNARKIYTVYSFLIWYGEYFVNPERA